MLGNLAYILWILWNAVDERGQGIRPVEAVALTGLIILLILNLYLLSHGSTGSPQGKS